jgi:hypothetical protein
MFHVEGIVLELTEIFGALIVYTDDSLRGENISVRTRANIYQGFDANVVERIVNRRLVFAAIFPKLPPGDYSVHYTSPPGKRKPAKDATVTIFPGEVAEIDWRS